MLHTSSLLTCSPWVTGATLAVLTTSLLTLSYLSSSFLKDVAYEPYSPEVEVTAHAVPRRGPEYPPVFAYYISGGRGDYIRMTRLLKAVYHPRNRYMLHLDAGAGTYERARLASYVWSEQVFLEFGNVHVIGRADPVDHRGASSVAAILHGAAVLLKISSEWDWLVTLGASDYPLVTQDDLLYAFSSVPRDLNFIDHNEVDWENRQIIVLDPNLQQNTNAEISFSSEYRPTPDDFEIFNGSPWTILSRSFIEHCVLAPDNLPRKLLLYFSNTLSPMEHYFQTVVGNSVAFRNSTVNHSFRLAVADGGSREARYEAMVGSRAAFAGWFGESGDDGALLQRIDEEILKRPLDGITPGEWCAGNGDDGDECTVGGDIDVVKHGVAGSRMASLMSEFVRPVLLG